MQMLWEFVNDFAGAKISSLALLFELCAFMYLMCSSVSVLGNQKKEAIEAF